MNLFVSSLLGGLVIGVGTLVAGERLRSNRSNWALLREDFIKCGHDARAQKTLQLDASSNSPFELLSLSIYLYPSVGRTMSSFSPVYNCYECGTNWILTGSDAFAWIDCRLFPVAWSWFWWTSRSVLYTRAFPWDVRVSYGTIHRVICMLTRARL